MYKQLLEQTKSNRSIVIRAETAKTKMTTTTMVKTTGVASAVVVIRIRV